MELLDWIVLIGTLFTIVGYGTWKTRGSKNVQDYVRGGNSSKWWTIGLSVMATQASAITFLSTPGQAFHDGMGFVQFYFGVPLAMIIICMVFIPIYHRLKVYTAYEFLENRFDLKTRSLTAILFLIQRGLAAGITIYAPAIILSAVLGWNLTYLNIIIGILVIIYTVSGGTKAVSVTQKYQMAVIFTGMFIAFFLIFSYLPENITFSNALDIAGVSGKMDILDFSFDFENRYTVWSGLIGGTFLALSYFGTDQSQVQRYLSGKSVKEMQMGLIFNGLLKVPMQFFILLVGVMVFVFYQFNTSPINFNPSAQQTILNSAYAEDYKTLENEQTAIFKEKQTLITNYITTNNKALTKDIQELNKQSEANREAAKTLIAQAAKEKIVDVETNDKDYVFIHFILNNLPRGLIGLLLAVILSAAMSSTASELNALASTTALDLYKRNYAQNKDENHYVEATKWFTLSWGILAIIVACVAYLADNLIQLVNIIGSIFYGNVLGIFLLAFFFKKIRGNAVFTAAIITQIIVIIGWWFNWMPYLWLNLFGCVLVIALAILIQTLNGKK
ncbi:sodium:solute symporter [Mangrovimonas spongiae]|uniref:Sodium:solute symporter n=1 Tax=Mangrovimonas spongiae TaxID=2494697 RepID=A0A3R9N6W7_9FLAO|nr:sodium:solute symporter [Mangrovimonas spongiae]RSK40383.1 sodium:solute symporter [Mangrovimonas spongiae]